MRIESQLTFADEQKVVLYYGDQTSIEDIKALKIERAREIYILGESTRNDFWGDHDAFNMNCLQHISEYAKQHKIQKALKCHVAIEHQSSFTMLKYTDMDKTLYEKIEFLPFNVYEIWAKRVIVENKAVITEGRYEEETKQIEYLPLGSREGIGINSTKRVHVVIIGMNEMGTALAMEAAQLMHFPNFTRNHSLRTTITFIDSEAVKEAEFLKGRYANLFALSMSRVIDTAHESFDKKWYDPMKDEKSRYFHLGDNFMDIRWEFIQGNVASDNIRKYITDVAVDKDTLCTVAVCVKHPQQSIATALYLPELVLKRAEQILVYQSNMADIVRKLSVGDDKWKRYRRLRPFGMINNCYEDSSLDETAPKLLNLFYKYKQDLRDWASIESYESVRQEAEILWNSRSIAYKWSSIYNVNSFAQKLRSAGSDIDDTYENQTKALSDEETQKALALTEHNRWLTERLMMGYRPLNKEEWQFFLQEEMLNPQNEEDQKAKKAKKEYWKAKSRAHLDICSNENLEIVDSLAPDNDLQLVKVIPQILKLSSEHEKQVH